MQKKDGVMQKALTPNWRGKTDGFQENYKQ
jgi:hypothetical protein